MDIYIALDGRQQGPFSVEQIRALAAAGRVDSRTLAWHAGLANWIPLHALPDLSEMRVPLPPPPAPFSAESQQQTSGRAIASLILGLTGPFCCITFIPAIVCGHLALGEIARSDNRLGGKGMAIAGMALGYIAVVCLILGLIIPLAMIPLAMRTALSTPFMKIETPAASAESQARCDVKAIAAAVEAYTAQYGKLPMVGAEEIKEDTTVGDPAGGASIHNAGLFNVLRDKAEGVNASAQLNPRHIVFFTDSAMADGFNYHREFVPASGGDPEKKGAFLDPWGHEYMIRLDYNGSGSVQTPGGETVSVRVIAWSLGPRGALNGGPNDLISWQGSTVVTAPPQPDEQDKPKQGD